MPEALKEARAAANRGEVPVGTVIVADGAIIARAGNETEADNDPTAHAEMLAIRRACAAQKGARLENCDLYVTLEPCPMCAAAIAAARIRRVYFGAYDPKSGGIEQGPRIFSHATCHHKPEIYGGIMERDCGALMTEFFKDLRDGS
ncbi:MAG: nucleoside deaminase [Alphaproteobacteria bacterium]|nr:nucleoside deaminase [Alphaproteobacteria bacterium]